MFLKETIKEEVKSFVWLEITMGCNNNLHTFHAETFTIKHYNDLTSTCKCYAKDIGDNLILSTENLCPHSSKLINSYFDIQII